MTLMLGSIPTPPTWHGMWVRLIEDTTPARGALASALATRTVAHAMYVIAVRRSSASAPTSSVPDAESTSENPRASAAALLCLWPGCRFERGGHDHRAAVLRSNEQSHEQIDEQRRQADGM